MTGSNASQPISVHAQGILDEATSFDGTPPVSDQAQLAAALGRRELIGLDDAVGIIGEGEVDLVVRPSARGRGIGRETLHALLSSDLAAKSLELRAWAHGENPAATALLNACRCVSCCDLRLTRHVSPKRSNVPDRYRKTLKCSRSSLRTARRQTIGSA